MQELITGWTNTIALFLPRLFLIAIIITLTLLIARSIRRAVIGIFRRIGVPIDVSTMLGRIARLLVLMLGALLTFQVLGWGEAVSSFIAGLGVVGLVVGFALQDIVKQFLSGILLLLFRPFRVGDDVQVSTFSGQVMDVTLSATVLKTVAGDEVLIPNDDVYTNAIINRSRYHLRRHTVAVSIPRTRDLKAAQTELLNLLVHVPGVKADPPPTIVGIGLDRITVQLEVRFWVDERTHNAATVTTDVIVAIGQTHHTEPPARSSSRAK